MLPPLRLGIEPVGRRKEVLGLTPSGDLAEVPVQDAMMLLGGVTGSGKTELLRALCLRMAMRKHTAVIYLDGKGNEAPMYRPRASCIGVQPISMRIGALWLVDEVRRRYSETIDLETFQPIEPTYGPDWLHLFVVFDEIGEMFKSRRKTEAADAEAYGFDPMRLMNLEEEFHSVMTTGREVGITVILATQKPTGDIVPTSIRDATTVRLGLRTTSGHHTRTIFGDDAEHAPTSTILEDERGHGYARVGEEGEFERFRGPRSPRVDAQRVLAASADLNCGRLGIGPEMPDKFVPLPVLIAPRYVLDAHAAKMARQARVKVTPAEATSAVRSHAITPQDYLKLRLSGKSHYEYLESIGAR